MDIPKSIAKYLVADEVIEKDFRLNGGKSLYASNKRLFIKKGNVVRDINYQQIFNIQIKEDRKWLIAVLGIMMFTIGSISFADGSRNIFPLFDNYMTLVHPLSGLILIVVGLVKTQFVQLTVRGFTELERLESRRPSDLEDILKFVREKGVKF